MPTTCVETGSEHRKLKFSTVSCDGKYEDAIAYYKQSRDLYESLDLQQNVAYRLNNQEIAIEI